MHRWIVPLVLLFTASLPADDRLIVCGDKAVFIIPADPSGEVDVTAVWRWTAADSPEIPADQQASFRTTDECKPYEGRILITASSGGVALIHRADKRAVFFTKARNAHSACLLPGQRVAVASSTGGDELLVYSLARSGIDVAPLARLKLAGAHGAHWDPKLERLWTLGTEELLRIEIRGDAAACELRVEQRWPLPTPGGHDLSPGKDGTTLHLSTHRNVYTFDGQKSEFRPHDALGDRADVKSVDEHPSSGRMVYHQAAKPNWWSDTLRFAGEERTIVLKGERVYKVRWERSAKAP